MAENSQWRRYRVSNGVYEYEWRDPEPSPSSTSDQAVNWSAGHSRVDSRDSEDPLAWSKDKYEEKTGDMEELTENLAKTTLDEGKEIEESTEPTTWSEWEWNEAYNCYSRYRNGQNGMEWEYDTTTKRGKETEEESTEPTTWSEWEWNEAYNCYCRYRNGQNGIEWEYGKTGKDKGKGKRRG